MINATHCIDETITEVAAGVLVQAVTVDRSTPYFLVDVEYQLPLTRDGLRAMAKQLLHIADAT
jgi:hypothetical protein